MYRWVVPGFVLPLYDRVSRHHVWQEVLRLRECQWRAPPELETRAFLKLRPLLAHAAEAVPYYRGVFRRAGIAPEDVRSVSDLSRIPITTRADLRASFPGLVTAGNLPARRRRSSMTSGSTGAPLEFYRDRADIAIRLGSLLFFREWAGAPLWDAMLQISSPAHFYQSEFLSSPLPRLARRVLLGERVERVSGMTLTPEAFFAWTRRLTRAGRYFIWSFPSYATILAARLLARGEALPAYPTVVITYAETLTEPNAAHIARAFRCPVVNHYSSQEIHHMAQTCPDVPSVLHVNSERAILRVVREDGSDAPLGERGRLVVTDLANYVMPFINYEIGDQARAGPRCACGRGFPTLTNLDGRVGETIRTLEGNVIAPVTLGRFLTHICHAIPYVWEYQAVQTAPNAVVLRVVPTPRFTEGFAGTLRKALAEFLGPGMNVEIEATDRIEAEPSGKRLVIKSWYASGWACTPR